jgi:hypothetical protein
MEPINWLLFAVFIVIVVYKLVRQFLDGRKAGKSPSRR